MMRGFDLAIATTLDRVVLENAILLGYDEKQRSATVSYSKTNKERATLFSYRSRAS